MSVRIVKAAPYFPAKKQSKNAGYLKFLHELPCVVTGKFGVEAAHVSFPNAEYGSYGRGKGTKVADMFALPLSPEEHRRQHSGNEREYWAAVGINPHLLCLKLYCVWANYGDAATEFAIAIINQTRNEK